MSEPLRILMTHDVDWSHKGPSKEHIIKRAERFGPNVIDLVRTSNYNPYNNISKMMDIEERMNVRSTFFFRTRYDDGENLADYQNDIGEMQSGGWEVALHVNKPDEIQNEKAELEVFVNKLVLGSRKHYLTDSINEIKWFHDQGIEYDSSITFDKYSISSMNTGCFDFAHLTVFPITFMETYGFTYMHLKEPDIIPTIKYAVEIARPKGFMTVLWHDCSIQMIGGRMYEEVLKFLSTCPNVEIVRAIDAWTVYKSKVAQN
jgi:hypothetical protein